MFPIVSNVHSYRLYNLTHLAQVSTSPFRCAYAAVCSKPLLLTSPSWLGNGPIVANTIHESTRQVRREALDISFSIPHHCTEANSRIRSPSFFWASIPGTVARLHQGEAGTGSAGSS